MEFACFLCPSRSSTKIRRPTTVADLGAVSTLEATAAGVLQYTRSTRISENPVHKLLTDLTSR